MAYGRFLPLQINWGDNYIGACQNKRRAHRAFLNLSAFKFIEKFIKSFALFQNRKQKLEFWILNFAQEFVSLWASLWDFSHSMRKSCLVIVVQGFLINCKMILIFDVKLQSRRADLIKVLWNCDVCNFQKVSKFVFWKC